MALQLFMYASREQVLYWHFGVGPPLDRIGPSVVEAAMRMAILRSASCQSYLRAGDMSPMRTMTYKCISDPQSMSEICT